MTRQRLADAARSEGPSISNGGPMQPGEIKIVHVKDSSGQIIRTVTIHRTTRAYAYDLCDAYNEAMSEDARRRGLEYYVTPAGEVKLGDRQDWTRQHTRDIARKAEQERQQWLRNNGAKP